MNRAEGYPPAFRENRKAGADTPFSVGRGREGWPGSIFFLIDEYAVKKKDAGCS